MICFPNAKVNLGLRILRKRPDGFHDLETVFYPIGWSDVLEATENSSWVSGDPRISLNFSGLPVPGSPSDNLLVKAYDKLAGYCDIPPVTAHLHKVIPMGAGLGGGSSDAAFFLTLLNDLFGLGLEGHTLFEAAASLGSDCGFFMHNSPCLATGKGEVLQPIHIDLKGFHFFVVHPGIHVGTREAYGMIRPAIPQQSTKQIAGLGVEQWNGLLVNDFEGPVFEAHPVLAGIKKQLLDEGAVYAAMSGSGSAVFGIFREPYIPERPFPANYLAWSGPC